MRRSISYEWIISSSFSTAKNVRRRNEKINEINVTTFGWVYIHNSVCFWGTMEILVSVSYTHLRAHETPEHLVCRLLLEKKKKKQKKKKKKHIKKTKKKKKQKKRQKKG